MNERHATRARDTIARLSGQGLDLASFWGAAGAVLAEVVPHYMGPCWYTFDPASLLVTSHFQPAMPELPPEWLAHEYFAADVHKLADTARSERGHSTIHERTGGDPGQSVGWNRYVKPYGGDQELLVALRTPGGVAWGMLGLYRQPGEAMFSTEEISLLHDLSRPLAEGARRGLLVGEAADPEGPESPGLVILREDWGIESITPGAAQWLDELPGGAWADRGRLPPSVLAVAGRALRSTTGGDAPGEVAFARVLSRAGRWIALHGAALATDRSQRVALATDRSQRVAVIIEPAHPSRISSLLMVAYGLTEREQDVTRLVLQGYSTIEIAARLTVSAQTVQQHLKGIFEKTGVHSRRDLVGTVFFAHYEPRLRDNERRAVDGRPLRGGPAVSGPDS
jgi:DNA-binding CsgD family transcriptional regulator